MSKIKPKWYRHEVGMIDINELNEAIDKYGFAAYGMYCFVLEQLTKAEEPVKLQAIASNARKYNGQKDELIDICTNYGLFEFDPETQLVSCSWLNESLEEQRAKALKVIENGKRGGRPPHKPNNNQDETKAEPNNNQTITNLVILENQTQTKPKPNKTKPKPNRIELNGIEQNRIEQTSNKFDVLNTREKNEFEKIEFVENTQTNFEAVTKTTAYPPTPFPDADLWRSWLNDYKSNEALKLNVYNQTGHHMTDEQIANGVEMFITHCQSVEENHQTRKECRKHFGYWVIKNAKELTKKQLTTGEHNLIAIATELDFSHLRGK